MTPKKQKILVLIDGSDRSRMTTEYVASVPAFKIADIVLYHVYDEIPEHYWDLDNAINPEAVSRLETWKKDKQKRINAYMEEAKSHLLAAGFSDNTITINIHKRDWGIARDILKESHNGYDAIVLRRRGMGTTRGIILGSVSSKLLSKLPEVPIFLAGRRPHNKKLLIAVDGSPSSTMAVEIVARHFGAYDYSAELFHVIRGVGTLNPTSPEFIPGEIIESLQDEVMRRMEDLKKILTDSGFADEKVVEKVHNGADSRAEEIVKEAESGDFGTIIVGKRGVSRIQEFFMGRVCYKIIHSGQDFTVWVV